jgi:polysaccharide export outer membrane protein
MRHKLLRALLFLHVLLLAFTEVGIAQIDNQPRIASQNAATLGRSLSNASATAAKRNTGLAQVPADFAQLKLAPGFLLSLNVLDDSDFTGAFRVDEQGDIALPVIGMLHVAGETVSEARSQIQQVLLEKKILQDPQVDLSIQEYSAPDVTIIGEVFSPGKYPLLVPRKLVDVLALAGGTTITAGNEVQITHDASEAEPILVHYSKATDPRVVANVIVHPGDTVQVKRAGIVYVLGAVTRPGGYVMQEEGTLTVLQAVSLANGTTLSASLGTVYLLRRNPDGTEVDIKLPYGKISHGKSAEVQLRATDVLYVPTSKIKSAFINGQSIIATAASASIYATVIY